MRNYAARLKITPAEKFRDCQRLIVEFGDELTGLETTKLYKSVKAQRMQDGLPQLLDGLGLPADHDGGAF